MTRRTEFKSWALEELKRIVDTQIGDKEVRVYLFGSWARLEEKHSSDIDLAIQYKTAAPPFDWNALIDHIEESTVPYKVDVVDMHHVNPDVKEEILTEGILWKGV